MMRIARNAYYWLLDYVYFLGAEGSNLFGKDEAETYRLTNGSPVLLIPGIYESWRFMKPVAALLRSKGYDVHVVESMRFNTGTVEDMAANAAAYIREQALTNIVIVAHSKGGLIGKYLLAMPEGKKRISRVIALHAPFSGSTYAYFFLFGSLRIFSPASKIIASLRADSASNKKIVSIYGAFDPHIPGGSRLEGATNVRLDTYGHFRIIADKRVHEAIVTHMADKRSSFGTDNALPRHPEGV